MVTALNQVHTRSKLILGDLRLHALAFAGSHGNAHGIHTGRSKKGPQRVNQDRHAADLKELFRRADSSREHPRADPRCRNYDKDSHRTGVYQATTAQTFADPSGNGRMSYTVTSSDPSLSSTISLFNRKP